MNPVLSIIIPTFKRPISLRRAVASALETAPLGDVEVLVVPNGMDSTWKSVAEEYREDPRVRWYPLATGNAAAARNYGLDKACGDYVRFLDDDDYLYSEALAQIDLIISNNVDLCTAPLENVLPNGEVVGTFSLPNSEDFPSAAFLAVGISLTQGSVFRRTAIEKVRWRENIALYDDYFWMLDLAKIGELKWLKTHEPIGAYVQHNNSRLSRIKRTKVNSQLFVAGIIELHQYLLDKKRSTSGRRCAAATALLTHAHSVFPSIPFSLGKIIEQAYAIDSKAVPLQKIFKDYPWLARNLKTTEWVMLLPRYLMRSFRRAAWSWSAWIKEG